MENIIVAIDRATFHYGVNFHQHGRCETALQFFGYRMSSLEELEVLADGLLKQAQELPPGTDRNDALKDVGKLRRRLDALKSQHRRDHTSSQNK